MAQVCNSSMWGAENEKIMDSMGGVYTEQHLSNSEREDREKEGTKREEERKEARNECKNTERQHRTKQRI